MVNFLALTAASLAAVLFSVSPMIFAQVEVVDLDVPSTRMADGSVIKDPSRYGKPPPASMTEFYFQLQALQEEVQTLRGLVEEQGFELKKLKQQQLDSYLDLDRRLSKASPPTVLSGFASAPNSDFDSAELGVEPPSAEMDTSKPDELLTYRAGIDAVLKQRNYDLGVEQFNQYLKNFPEGLYAANAKYWLGQIYMQRESYSEAKQWFNKLISKYPNHQKTPEAQFKLGKILHLDGDIDAAKRQLEAVVKSGSSAAKLARDYLDDNF